MNQCDVCGVEIPKRRRFCDDHTTVGCVACGVAMRRRKGTPDEPLCQPCRSRGVTGATVAASSISEAARSGDPRALLVALRDNIAAAIDEGIPARDLASLSRRLMEIDHEINVIDAREAEEGGAGGPIPDEIFDIEAI